MASLPLHQVSSTRSALARGRASQIAPLESVSVRTSSESTMTAVKPGGFSSALCLLLLLLLAPIGALYVVICYFTYISAARPPFSDFHSAHCQLSQESSNLPNWNVECRILIDEFFVRVYLRCFTGNFCCGPFIECNNCTQCHPYFHLGQVLQEQHRPIGLWRDRLQQRSRQPCCDGQLGLSHLVLWKCKQSYNSITHGTGQISFQLGLPYSIHETHKIVLNKAFRRKASAVGPALISNKEYNSLLSKSWIDSCWQDSSV